MLEPNEHGFAEEEFASWSELDYDDKMYVSKVALSRPERAILRQIAFWYPKAKTQRDGHIWLIKSAQEFREEGIDYEADTIWRAIRALVKRNVLITEKHLHPYGKTSGPVLWIRPTAELVDDLKIKKKKKEVDLWEY